MISFLRARLLYKVFYPPWDPLLDPPTLGGMDTSLQKDILHAVTANWNWLGPILEALILWPLLSGVLGIFARRNNPAEWETWALKHPYAAVAVEFARTNGPDVLKNPTVLQRYAARKAGKIPMDALEKIPLPQHLREALKNPVMRNVVAEMLRQHQEAEAAEAPPALAPVTPVPPAPPPVSPVV